MILRALNGYFKSTASPAAITRNWLVRARAREELLRLAKTKEQFNAIMAEFPEL